MSSTRHCVGSELAATMLFGLARRMHTELGLLHGSAL